ncbi:hypothetical protein V1477_016520 [Vespula maculifrons]|uniref:Uncharacterized protein n=1 Tax=Vespula maculifrons TaxID=7453 RepID=A0ABD2B9H2_VESMC
MDNIPVPQPISRTIFPLKRCLLWYMELRYVIVHVISSTDTDSLHGGTLAFVAGAGADSPTSIDSIFEMVKTVVTKDGMTECPGRCDSQQQRII